MFLATLLAVAIAQDMQVEIPFDQNDYIDPSAPPFSDQAVYLDDPLSPGVEDPIIVAFAVRPGTRYTSTNASGGSVTFTLTAPARVTVSIPLMSRQTAVLGTGTSFRGVDRNRNGIPDLLEGREIVISPLQGQGN
ncbi:hypothetical protein [Brevundimonas phoenicis]|uniref:hypothetical protein n=1 Tax=unclassified Brevundimonas TaxID=2622653 RepID=UPI0039A32AD3